ncbi:NCS cytosine-purine permease [Stereum hirsutum FP-91666 SS1]|uniref:NCS cytosine-purine permease n=1 Tax=Stereum hirsutum (strain FP-91666) TaxID=721885 RepID=UPI0004409E6C|nr:NCS cytosine-purine permease [Stereum hirsutum FP-91666 SS1]EIM87684.1 NCS cytosine-purine permease [Stereum hirsutum FP-91666 SS1]
MSDNKHDVKKDIEKDAYGAEVDVQSSQDTFVPSYKYQWLNKFLSWGVEYRGIHPVPLEARTETHYSKIFFIWLSANVNILSFSTGTLGPVVYGLGLRDSCLVILFFNILTTLPPAYFTTWGPRLGLRQMCLSRYTFGYFGVALPSILAIIGGTGFCILNCILGGQTLASVTNGSLSWTVGIVIIAVISLVISFFGMNILNWYERVAWFPVLLVFLVATGLGGKNFISPPPAEPATAQQVLSFGATIAGFVITWSTFSADYTAYYSPNVSSWRIFTYSYFGLLIPIVLLESLGAAAVIAVDVVPDWEAGYADGNVGGLVEAMLHPVGGFGKFLTVLLSLSVTANNAPTIYSLCLGSQTFIPPLVVVPRWVFSIVATAIIIPLSIVGQHKFYTALSNFLGLIGYWASAWIAILLVEHLVFRHGDFSSYDLRVWNRPSQLPTGIAAVSAGVLAFGLVIPAMDQVWFTGPIAAKTGDLGFELAFCTSAVLYLPFRWAEKRWRGI